MGRWRASPEVVLMIVVAIGLVHAQSESDVHGHLENGEQIIHDHEHDGVHDHVNRGQKTLITDVQPKGEVVGHRILHPDNPDLCPLGCKGDTGVKGGPGPRGRQGPTGVVGDPGEPGYGGWAGWPATDYAAARARAVKGDVGSPGDAGAPGEDGTPGLDGVEGPAGPAGGHGPRGEPGRQGTPGLTGLEGRIGPAGSQGPRGGPGADGPDGLAGANGYKGDIGQTGDHGLPGLNGADGIPGVGGIQGAKGVVGPRGPRGNRGSKGEQGNVGDEGITGDQGATGEKGAAGDVGQKGTTGLTGDQGMTGDNGDQGARGEYGPDITTTTLETSGPCNAGTEGVTNYDNEAQRLFFCNGDIKECVEHQDCAADCQVTPWGEWGDCSTTCGAGQRTRNRHVMSAAGPLGKACPALQEAEDCNLITCECEDPAEIANGYMATNPVRTIGSVVEWGCDAGYRLFGPANSVCMLAPGASKPEFTESPRCYKRQCPRLRPIENGVIGQERESYAGDTATITCDNDYVVNGEAVLTCTGTGTWDYPVPKCVRVMCTDPGAPMNGARSAPSFEIASAVTYSCNEGYTLVGAAVSRCLSGGNYATPKPTCKEVDCGPPLRPANGRVGYSRTSFTAVARYTCNMGYTLTGAMAATCEANGQWSDMPPVCRLVECGDPGSVEFGSRTVSATTYGARATFRCQNGYILNGNDERICTTSGWSGSLPYCRSIDCGPAPIVANAQMSGSGSTTYLTGRVSYTCNDGLTLKGDRTLVCLASGRWSSAPPTCEVVDCGDVAAPANGDRYVMTTTVSSQLTYFCHTGYNLVGGNQDRTCQNNGQWSGQPPRCVVVDCKDPGAPMNGRVLTFNTPAGQSPYSYGASVTFTCKEGYMLRGAATRTCTACGEWSDSMPLCVPMECPSLNNIRNGDMDVANRSVDSFISFQCDPGFSLEGEKNLRCGSDTAWTTSPPLCEPTQCAPLPAIDNGVVFSDGNFFGDVASISCSPGYKLQGSETRVCEETMEWSGVDGTCTLVDCGRPTDIANGQMSGSVFTFGSSVTFSCSEGYRLMGSSSRECMASGVWSGSEPTCVAILCPNPGFIANGERTPEGINFAYNAVVRYSCNAGYSLSGNEVRTCGADGTWSDAAPSCVALLCRDPGTPASGSRLFSSLRIGSTVQYSCNTGFNLVGSASATCETATSSGGAWSSPLPVCEVVDCGDPGRPENGGRRVFSTTYGGDGVQYNCNSGYEIIGHDTRICLSSGLWSGSVPDCVLIDCGDPGTPQNGARTGNSFTFESTVSYTCNDGYELQGSATQTCQQTSRWTDQRPVCALLTCANPGVLANGRRIGNDFSFGATVRYECNDGFTLTGQSSRVCDSSGVFSGSAPSCIPLECADPGVPVNGDRLMSSRLVSSTVDFTCNTGFTLTGASSITCTSTPAGIQWSAALPVCAAVTCGDPEFGTWDGSRTAYATWLDFNCNAGFLLSGSSSRRCTESGSFSGNPAQCTAVDCGDPNRPSGGTVSVAPSTSLGGVASYACNPGYNLVGASSRTCQGNGQWSGSEPFCIETRCDNPGYAAYSTRSSLVDDNVFTPGDMVSYSCLQGFYISGDAALTCGVDGQWSSPRPTCVAHLCADPGPLELGDRQMSSLMAGARVTYTCNVGFTLQGSPSRRCIVNLDNTAAAWSSQEPICVPNSCPPTEDIANGQWSYTSSSNSFAYTCNNGYSLVGNAVRFCLNSGSLSGSPPSCQIVDCGTPRPIADGTVQAPTTIFGSRASYSCNTGYRLSGSAIRTCEANGLWSGSASSCIVVDCGNPGSPAHGNRDSSNVFTYDASASFTCDPGYELVGEQSIKCQGDGTWSSSIPVCRLLQCSDPEVPENGYRDLSSLTVGSTVEYFCNVGYSLFGGANRECLANTANTGAAWSGSVPECRIVDCGPLEAPVRGSRDGNVFTYQSTVSFSCQTGYAIQGSVTRRCQATGLWSGVQPICQIVDCGTPATIANGNTRFTTTVYGSSVQHTCRSGYLLAGDASRTCQADGLWSGAAPACYLVSCDNPGIPAYGSRTGDIFTFNSDVTFSCDTGYRLDGSSSIRCTAAGQWSNPVPSCIALDCRDPGTPANGDRALSSTLVGSSVNYTCNIGYTLQGAVRRNCEATADGRNAAWSASLPVCTIVDCGRQNAPANGRISGNVFSYGATISHTCNVGYALTGSEFRTCQANGQFSGVAPACVVVDCLDPGTPQNGDRTGSLTTYNNVFEFSCNTGYTLFGSDRRTCLATSAWSGNQPTCHIVDCGDPGTPSNGARGDSLTTYLSTVTFTCNNGYRLAGSRDRQCQADGEWSGTVTTCVAIICEDPGVPVNGGRDGNSFTLNDEVSYFCNPGYRLVGDTSRTCRANGFFDRSLPSCQLISCPDPGIPQFGSREGDIFTYNSQVSFTCNVGYRLINSQQRICQATGDWSGIQPVCNPIDCGILTSPGNGEVVVTSTGYQGQGTYSCNTGYELVGPELRVCEADSLWSESMPECRIISCCSLEAPANGAISISSVTYQSVATFSCNSGFNLVGSEVRTCQSDGTWSGTRASCERGMCMDPGTPVNGRKVSFSLAIGSNIEYECFTGYRLVGQQTITCLAGETWSHPVPTCEIINCGNPGSVENGQHNGSTFTFGQIIGYTCDDSYTLNGPMAIRCEGTGLWSPPPPTCDSNCIVSQWSDYGPCSTTCGDGLSTRTRVVLRGSQGRGIPCPELDESQSCNLRPCVACDGRFPEGHIAFRIRTTNVSVASDVIVVVDESASMEGEHQWLPGMIGSLEAQLKAENIGIDPALPNMYALVGFGQRDSSPKLYPHTYNDTRTGATLFPQTLFSAAAAQLYADPSGRVEDGYLAIQHAFDTIPLRRQSNVHYNVIFITDEDRDMLGDEGRAITRSKMKVFLRNVHGKGALLNVVVDNDFSCGATPALGVDFARRGFVADGIGDYTACPTGTIGRGYQTTRVDYTTMALELEGAAWDINLLRATGATAASFTKAFTDVKTAEINRQIDSCRRCVCRDNGSTGAYRCSLDNDQAACKCRAGGNQYENGQCIVGSTTG